MSFTANWSEREGVIAQLIADLCPVVPDLSPEVRWAKNASAGDFISPDTGLVIDLSTVSVIPYGTAQKSRTVDGDGLVREAVTQHATWTIRATVKALETEDPRQSITTAERIRLALAFDAAQLALSTIDCGLQRALSTVPLGRSTADNRIEDVVSFDFALNTTTHYGSDVGSPPIEHVEIDAAWNPPPDEDPTPIDFVEIDLYPE